jgi:hypothetical protein
MFVSLIRKELGGAGGGVSSNNIRVTRLYHRHVAVTFRTHILELSILNLIEVAVYSEVCKLFCTDAEIVL